MKSFVKKIIAIPNYLVSQLFLYFSFVFLLILFFSLIIRSFDTRQMAPLDKGDIAFFVDETNKLQTRYDLDEVFERDLTVQTPTELDVILVEKNTDIVSGVSQNNIKPFLSFLYQTEGSAQPMAKSIGETRINGPFLIKTDKREYKTYFLQNITAQASWFNELIDNPYTFIQILVLIGLPAILFLSWYITRPVKDLRLTASSVARGSLIVNEKIEKQGIQEFRDVGKSLNQMITSLQSINTHQQRLLSDISHELKTPLARLQLSVALLKKKIGENKETERIEGEIEKMNAMVLDLLTISRQQLGQHLERSIFPIVDIWYNVLVDTKFETEMNGIKLNVKNHIGRPENYYVNGHQSSLAMALENIIRNAQKYAKSKINVDINFGNKYKSLVITVDDDGHGVPESELSKIFKPFYRVDEARARQSGGTGLGLTIVENAITQNKGTVTALKSDLGGLRIEIKLPLWNA